MKKRIMFLIFLLFTGRQILFCQSSSSNRLSSYQLDLESQQCMKCHDGSGGNAIELRPSDAPVEFDRGLWMKTKNHSIGMSYSASRQKNPAEYVSETSLNENIKLIDGKIGCLSCHVAKPRLLASLSAEIPDECPVDVEGTEKAFQGNLCINCHIK